jgi:hypothetical protein
MWRNLLETDVAEGTVGNGFHASKNLTSLDSAHKTHRLTMPVVD